MCVRPVKAHQHISTLSTLLFLKPPEQNTKSSKYKQKTYYHHSHNLITEIQITIILESTDILNIPLISISLSNTLYSQMSLLVRTKLRCNFLTASGTVLSKCMTNLYYLDYSDKTFVVNLHQNHI